MNVRVRLAACAVAALAAACAPDRAPNNPFEPTAPRRATAALAPDAAPQFVTIFPSIFITGGLTPVPTASISPPSVATFDRTFHLTSSDPALLPQLPATVTVLAGDDRVNVGLVPPTVTAPTRVTVTATGAGTSVSAVLTLLPPGSPPPPQMVDTIFATPLTVAAGTTAKVTVRLTSPAPAGGVVVGLSENLPLSATMPPAVFVPAGASVVTVPIVTHIGFPNSTTTVEIRAALGATIVHEGINVVTGNVALPLGIGPTTLSAPLVGGIATVAGGTSLQGRVSLSGAAPSGGALVTLVSTDTTVATVPASVVIPAGASSATFTVTTRNVTTTSTTNVGGGFAGGFNVTSLRVTPASTTPPPPVTPPPTTPPSAVPGTPALVSPAADARFARGATIAFDWSDVAGAATYTIQIGNKDTFPTPYVATQSTSASQTTIAGLPAQTLWVRVRGVAADGTVGAWSSARRFELK